MLKSKFEVYKMCAQENTIETRGMRWDQTLIPKANEMHYYIKVSEEKGGQLVLSGAPNRWKKNGTKDDIYISEIRLAGNKTNIRKVLEGNTYSSKDVDRLIASAYTSFNYALPEDQGGKQEQFQNEVNKYKEFKKTNVNKQKTSVDISLEKLQSIVEDLNNSENRKKIPSKNTRKYWILEKYGKLSEGKVIDVSLMKQDGSGIKTRSVPKETSKKYGNFFGVAVVSSDFKNYDYTLRTLQIPQSQINDCVTQYRHAAGIVSKPQVKKSKPETTPQEVKQEKVKQEKPKEEKPKKVTPPRESLKTIETPVAKPEARSRFKISKISYNSPGR